MKHKATRSGTLVGLIILLITYFGLEWTISLTINSHRMVKNYAHIQSEPLSAENEGRIVFTQGEVLASAALKDGLLDEEINGLGIIKIVEMYQWQPRDQELLKNWFGYVVRSTEIETMNPDPPNPNSFPDHDHYRAGESFPKASIGDLDIPKDVLKHFERFAEDYEIDEDKWKSEGKPGVVFDNKIYPFGHPRDAKIGDIRISYKVIPNGVYSIIAVQKGEALSRRYPERNEYVLYLEKGIKSVEEMVGEEVDRLEWIRLSIEIFSLLLIAAMIQGLQSFKNKNAKFVPALVKSIFLVGSSYLIIHFFLLKL